MNGHLFLRLDKSADDPNKKEYYSNNTIHIIGSVEPKIEEDGSIKIWRISDLATEDTNATENSYLINGIKMATADGSQSFSLRMSDAFAIFGNMNANYNNNDSLICFLDSDGKNIILYCNPAQYKAYARKFIETAIKMAEDKKFIFPGSDVDGSLNEQLLQRILNILSFSLKTETDWAEKSFFDNLKRNFFPAKNKQNGEKDSLANIDPDLLLADKLKKRLDALPNDQLQRTCAILADFFGLLPVSFPTIVEKTPYYAVNEKVAPEPKDKILHYLSILNSIKSAVSQSIPSLLIPEQKNKYWTAKKELKKSLLHLLKRNIVDVLNNLKNNLKSDYFRNLYNLPDRESIESSTVKQSGLQKFFSREQKNPTVEAFKAKLADIFQKIADVEKEELILYMMIYDILSSFYSNLSTYVFNRNENSSLNWNVEWTYIDVLNKYLLDNNENNQLDKYIKMIEDIKKLVSESHDLKLSDLKFSTQQAKEKAILIAEKKQEEERLQQERQKKIKENEIEINQAIDKIKKIPDEVLGLFLQKIFLKNAGLLLEPILMLSHLIFVLSNNEKTPEQLTIEDLMIEIDNAGIDVVKNKLNQFFKNKRNALNFDKVESYDEYFKSSLKYNPLAKSIDDLYNDSLFTDTSVVNLSANFKKLMTDNSLLYFFDKNNLQASYVSPADFIYLILGKRYFEQANDALNAPSFSIESILKKFGALDENTALTSQEISALSLRKFAYVFYELHDANSDRILTTSDERYYIKDDNK